MASVECAHEADVLMMVETGRWPARAPADLRAHAAACEVCADLAVAALAIDDARGHKLDPRLPGSGTVWWRAQLRARQDVAKAVVRPITVAQAVFLAVAGGLAGAVFGATTDWFQRVIERGWGTLADAAAGVRLPSLPPLPSDVPATLANYSTGLAIVGVGTALAMAVVVWALREE